MKIYLSNLNESWVVDRLRKDWYKENPDISTYNIKHSDIIWIISPWVWKKISKRNLLNKKVICSIYHIDFDKFDELQKKEFYKRDKYVDLYHVISDHTKNQLEKLTQKKIISIPFWVDETIFYEINDKQAIRDKYGIEGNKYLIGSFQRDTEGSDLKSPKLIKGPDIFFEIVKQIHSVNKNMEIILSGKRRNYLIDKLEEFKIPYKYFEMIQIHEVNELYNILDLYIVSARVEGGPQAIMECAVNKTPIVSTDVGIAPQILKQSSIFKDAETFRNAKPDTNYAYKKASQYVIPNGMKMYIKMFMDVYEN